jgi:hypothetical protein
MSTTSPPLSSDLSSSPDDETLYCPSCSYDLRGIEGNQRCPECGLVIDREGLRRSRIPWVHRRQIGRVRAYLRTFWFATVQTKTLAGDVFRPLGYSDAKRFSLVTCVLAWIAPAVAIVIGLWQGEDILAGAFGGFDPFRGTPGQPLTGILDIALPWAAGAAMLPVMPVCMFLFLLAVSGVPSYWFHPKRLPVVRQNRAVAVSYYASAPLALLLLAGACVLAMIPLSFRESNHSVEQIQILLGLTIASLVLMSIVAFYANTLRLYHQATGASAGGTIGFAALLPLSWLAVGLLTLYGIPWVVGFLRLVIESLRV